MASPKKPSGAQYRKIRAIKAKGYSASYEKRLISGVLRGKSRQEARGHRPGEARERRDREREEFGGLSRAEEISVRNWYQKRFNPSEHQEKPTEEDVVEFAQGRGIADFRVYQKEWNAVRKQYIADIRNGAWASKGLGELERITN